MRIWFQDYSLEQAIEMTDRYMAKTLGLQLIELGEDYIKATMPVDDRTKMPLGLLHGGASCFMAESLASYASYFCINPAETNMVGLEINANHIKSVTEGQVMGICRPIHLGRLTKVWEIRISDETDELVCISRMTVATFPKKK